MLEINSFIIKKKLFINFDLVLSNMSAPSIIHQELITILFTSNRSNASELQYITIYQITFVQIHVVLLTHPSIFDKNTLHIRFTILIKLL